MVVCTIICHKCCSRIHRATGLHKQTQYGHHWRHITPVAKTIAPRAVDKHVARLSYHAAKHSFTAVLVHFSWFIPPKWKKPWLHSRAVGAQNAAFCCFAPLSRVLLLLPIHPGWEQPLHYAWLYSTKTVHNINFFGKNDRGHSEPPKYVRGWQSPSMNGWMLATQVCVTRMQPVDLLPLGGGTCNIYPHGTGCQFQCYPFFRLYHMSHGTSPLLQMVPSHRCGGAFVLVCLECPTWSASPVPIKCHLDHSYAVKVYTSWMLLHVKTIIWESPPVSCATICSLGEGGNFTD